RSSSLSFPDTTLFRSLEGRALRPSASEADPDRVRSSPEEELARFKPFCSGTRVVMIVGGLGGGIATSVGPTLASAARQSGSFVLCFAILPFDCEGSLRRQT